MRPDQERVRNLLIDTVTLLCKNSVQFEHELHVEGLLGVSVDKKDVFFVHISKEFSNSPSGGATVTETSDETLDDPTENSADSNEIHGKEEHRVSETPSSNEQVSIKTEAVEQPEQEECLIVEDPHIKLEGRASPVHLIAGQRRPTKRTADSGNHHQYGDGSLQVGYSIGGSDSHYDNSQYSRLGEPVIKRQASDGRQDGDYLHGDDSGDTGEGTPWPSLTGPAGFDPSQAFQHDSDNSQISIDGSQQPGCSSWSTPGRGPSDSMYPTGVSVSSSLPEEPFLSSQLPNRGLPCPICRKWCRSKYDLDGHVRTHTGERPHKCPQCQYATSFKHNLTSHLKTHTNLFRDIPQ